MESDPKKRDEQTESEQGPPSFDEVVRKMLNTPSKPKSKANQAHSVKEPRKIKK